VIPFPLPRQARSKSARLATTNAESVANHQAGCFFPVLAQAFGPDIPLVDGGVEAKPR
jgi:hypothetical protein